MSSMPFRTLDLWLRGLVALALLGVGVFLVREWFVNQAVFEGVPLTYQIERAPISESPYVIHREDWQFGDNAATAHLPLCGIALIVCALAVSGLLSSEVWRRGRPDGFHALRPVVVHRVESGETQRRTVA